MHIVSVHCGRVGEWEVAIRREGRAGVEEEEEEGEEEGIDI
jgi:hypothetical protein